MTSPLGMPTLDRRAVLLADKIKHRIAILVDALSPAPFTTQMASAEALKFWRKHRYSPLGSKIMAGWTPFQVIELDNWLSRHPDPTLPSPPPQPMALPRPSYAPLGPSFGGELAPSLGGPVAGPEELSLPLGR